MKTVAVVLCQGPPERAVELATHLDSSPSIQQVLVAAAGSPAGDQDTRPSRLPAEVGWLAPGPGDGGPAEAFRQAGEMFPTAAAFLCVQDDVWLPHETIDACLELLAASNIGVVAPTLVDDRGRRPAASGLTRLLVPPIALGRVPADRPYETEWVDPAAMFVKAACQRRIRLDGRYGPSFAHIDFCHQVRAAGWHVVVSPARAVRRGGAERAGAGRRRQPGWQQDECHRDECHRDGYHEVRDRLWFARAHRWPARTALFALWSVVSVLPRTVAEDLARRGRAGPDRSATGQALRGLADGLRRPLPR